MAVGTGCCLYCLFMYICRDGTVGWTCCCCQKGFLASATSRSSRLSQLFRQQAGILCTGGSFDDARHEIHSKAEHEAVDTDILFESRANLYLDTPFVPEPCTVLFSSGRPLSTYRLIHIRRSSCYSNKCHPHSRSSSPPEGSRSSRAQTPPSHLPCRASPRRLAGPSRASAELQRRRTTTDVPLHRRQCHPSRPTRHPRWLHRPGTAGRRPRAGPNRRWRPGRASRNLPLGL